jgi:hypothetical protein
MKVARWIVFLLFIALTGRAYASASENIVSIDSIQKYALKHPNVSITQLLKHLKASYPEIFRNSALIFKSESLQKAGVDPLHPRAILSSADGSFMLTFTGNSARPEFQTVELIEYDSKQNKYKMAELSRGNQLHLEKNPAKCLSCHGTEPRPIWEAYDLWPGAYAGDNSDHFGETDHAYLAKYIASRGNHERYALLDHKLTDDRYARPFGTGEGPAAQLNFKLAADLGTWAQARLEQNPNFVPYRAAFIAASFGCPAEKWLPPPDVRKSQVSLKAFTEELTKTLEQKRLARIKRAELALDGKKLDLRPDGFKAKHIAPALWVLHLAGIPYNKFTSGFDRDDPAFLNGEPANSFPFVAAAGMLPPRSTINKIPTVGGKKIPIWRESLNEFYFLDEESSPESAALHKEACKRLESDLQQMPRGDITANPSPSTVKPLPTRDPLCLSSRFSPSEQAQVRALLKTCMQCHPSDRESPPFPRIPFENPIQFAHYLASKPTAKTSKHDSLTDEILDRINSSNPNYLMPPTGRMKEATRALMQRYVSACHDSLIEPSGQNQPEHRGTPGL